MSETGPDQPSPAILAFEGFSGLNTEASRPGIKDTQMAWSDGWMPIGEFQLRTLPGIGASIFTTPTGTAIPFFDFGNIGTMPLSIVVPSNGSVWTVNTNTLTVTEVAPAGTISSPSRLTLGITQWGSQFIILVANQTDGYFIYDGSSFYSSGGISPIDSASITAGGSGYTSVPSYTVYGGSGSGVTLTPVVTDGSVTGLTVTSPGTGYLPGDIVQVAFSGGGSDTTPILEAVLGPQGLSGVNIISGGGGYPTGTYALGIGGPGSGATGTFTASGGMVTSAAITAAGSGYTSTPAITFPIPGSGAAITATESGGAVASLTISSGGSGYIPGTYSLAFSGGGGSGATGTYTVNSSGVVASAVVTAGGTGYTSAPTVSIPTGSGAHAVAIVDAGGVASITIVNGGTNLTSTPSLTIVGGGGTGATAVATLTAGAITSVTMTNGGSDYTSAPAVEVQTGINNAAAAILDVMPFGIQGTAVETYQSRIWVTNGPEVIFSSPQSYTDFSTANGGGSFTSNDSFLRVSYIQPKQTNGFLYLIADSSVNYIAGVQTSGSPVTTTFTNQNADPEVGTPYAATVDVLGSNIVFANAFGVHVSYGGRVTKISNELDGIYNTVPSFGGFQLSAAKAIIFGKRVWMVLVPVIDQITGNQVNKLFMWDEKKWWSSQQDIALIYIQNQEIASVLTAYGTDGTKIYPMFTTPSVAFQKSARSRLWSKPSGYMAPKSSNRLWMLGQYYSNSAPNIIFSVDSETTSTAITLTPNPTGLTSGIYVAPPTATGQAGTLLGMTIQTNAADMVLISAAIDAVDVGYRG